ncbi:hypothetical protein KC365_g58 [Hortaea werneckii]|nr:hypothetical protein KC339_g56 [Hortaea werneckii]KAI7245924.1 hypothetical protein KC365_g58 [Hortaea werneckii]
MRTSLGVWTALEAVEGSNVTHSVTVAIQALELTARQEKSMAWWRMRISALLRAVYTDTLDEDGEKECTTPQRMTRMAKSVCVPNGQDRRAIPTFPLRWRSADLRPLILRRSTFKTSSAAVGKMGGCNRERDLKRSQDGRYSGGSASAIDGRQLADSGPISPAAPAWLLSGVEAALGL